MKEMATAPQAGRAQGHAAGFNPGAMHAGTWNPPAAGKSLARGRGWADPGERVAMKYVAIEARCRPILDIGVGAGRTTELLRAISHDYVGIDDSPAMVEMCRAAHPQAQISLMHARDLGRFEAERFSLVVFSFNGIDAVSLADRHTLLREVHRVLQPNGLLVLSAHNRDGIPACDLRFENAVSASSMQPGPGAWWRVRSLPGSLRNYVRERVFNQADDRRPMRRGAADRVAAPSTYTTLAQQKQELREAGLQTELVLDNLAGRPVAEGANTSAFSWMHYIARKL